MTREPNKQKYERILERLANGDKQSSIIISEKCSYGTISAAKQWEKNGRPNTVTTTRSTSTNRTKIVLSIPNYWLECLNEDIMSGIWADYSDAIIDIIRFFFRTRMENYQPEPSSMRKRAPNLRREIMKELKDVFTPEQFREFFRTYFGDDDSIPKKREKLQKDRKSEFLKEIDMIKSSFKRQESEDYTFINYHGQPLIKEEYDVIIELEKEVGIVPKWNFTLGEKFPKPRELAKFSYIFFGNHIIGLILVDKSLNTLPKSINQLTDLFSLDPLHHPPKLFTDNFNGMIIILFRKRPEYRTASLIFRNPFPGKLARTNFRQNLFHLFFGVFGDDPRASRHIAVLSRIAYRIPHIGDAALVNKINDQF